MGISVINIFLFQVLEQGSASTQAAILLILHCVLHYIDINSLPSPTMSSDLIYTVSKFVEVCFALYPQINVLF